MILSENTPKTRFLTTVLEVSPSSVHNESHAKFCGAIAFISRNDVVR